MSGIALAAVALGEQVSADKPLGVALGDQGIVLWRDKAGRVNALEDRCPHRRAPLSLGCVRPDGNLQCGYHGWSFDGSGKVINVPQMRRDGKLPAIYHAERFAVREHGGFVFVGDGALPEMPALASHGETISLLDRARLYEILLDGPELLLDVPGVHISEYPLADPVIEQGSIVYERSCRKKGGIFPDRLRAELPLALRITLDPATGLCSLTLRDRDFRVLLTAMLALTPARRGTTAIRWRADGQRRAPFAIRTPTGAELDRLQRNLSNALEPGEAYVPERELEPQR